MNPNTKSKLRDACEQDMRNLLEIEKESFNNSRLKKSQFIYLLKHGKCDFIVCEINQKADPEIVGYAISQYRKNSTEARIYSIAIGLQFRKQGLGILLLNEICARAVKRGCKSIRLEMDISNEAAKAFYKRLGFYENGIIKHYYGQNLHAVRFKKGL
jgi:ribosomal-protein-alanine acetyltransferase